MSWAEKPSHYYAPDGTPRFDATLSVARAEGLYVSPSVLKSFVANPGLESWKRREDVKAALVTPPGDDEGPDDYAKRIVSREEDKSAADLGKKIHDLLERQIHGEPIMLADIEPEVWQLYKPVSRFVTTSQLRGQTETVYVSHEYGVAGTVDYNGLMLDDGRDRDVIVDWKSQNVKKYRARRPKYDCLYIGGRNERDMIDASFYDEWLWQLGIYRACIRERTGRLPTALSVVISTNRDCPGVAVRRWTGEDLDYGWETAKAVLAAWRLVNKFPHARERVAA